MSKRYLTKMRKREFTPEKIDSLKPNEIFVFGSNLQGEHRGGAARVAHQFFGAVLGVGVGLQGQSYAIPTMHGGVEVIKPYIDQFVRVAALMPDLKFYVTRIGCGIAGFSPMQIAPLFDGAYDLPNVVLPVEFYNIINTARRYASESGHFSDSSLRINFYPEDKAKMSKLTTEQADEYRQWLIKNRMYIICD